MCSSEEETIFLMPKQIQKRNGLAIIYGYRLNYITELESQNKSAKRMNFNVEALFYSSVRVTNTLHFFSVNFTLFPVNIYTFF